MSEIDKWNKRKLDSIKELYDLMEYWRDIMNVMPYPGFIAWQLGDVPRIVSFKSQNREIVAMSGLDCWGNGDLKFPNVSKEEALVWLMFADENECVPPSFQ